MERHDVLCNCGWGVLNCPAEIIPNHCPYCGHDLWQNAEQVSIPVEEDDDILFHDEMTDDEVFGL